LTSTARSRGGDLAGRQKRDAHGPKTGARPDQGLADLAVDKSEEHQIDEGEERPQHRHQGRGRVGLGDIDEIIAKGEDAHALAKGEGVLTSCQTNRFAPEGVDGEQHQAGDREAPDDRGDRIDPAELELDDVPGRAPYGDASRQHGELGPRYAVGARPAHGRWNG
jgi:hypothetical protein